MTAGRQHDATGRKTQLLRGVLDICLLAVITERPRYGYELVEILAVNGLPLVSEGSIYPLLARMERAGHVESHRVRSAAGPPRKYYRLTPAGAEELAAARTTWHAFAVAVSQVLAEPLAPLAGPESVATTPRSSRVHHP